MSRLIDLGSNAFHLLGSTLTLTTNATANFILPEDFTVSNLMTLGRILESRDAWVIQGPDLVVNVCMQANCDSTSLASFHLKLAGDLVRNAKLWSDLGLLVSSKSSEYSHGSNGITTMILTLSIQEKLLGTRILNLPCKLRNLLSAEVQAPAGVRKVVLSEVHISLRFHYRNWERDMNPSQFPETRMEPKEHCVLESTSDYPLFKALESLSIPYSTQFLMPLISKSSTDSHRRWILSSGLNSRDSSPQLKCASRSFHVNYGDYEYDATVEQTSHALCTLLDSGFRDIIALYPLGTAIGIKCSAEGLRYKLSSIAPSIFSPGYRDAMHQRACFIPVIAKSMASILEGNGDPILEQKLAALRAFYASQYGNRLDPEPRAPNARSMIKCLLWSIAQNGVYRPEAARKLSPIGLMRTDERESSSFDEDLFADYCGSPTNHIDVEAGCFDGDMDSDAYTLTLLEDEFSSLGLDDDINEGNGFIDILENNIDTEARAPRKQEQEQNTEDFLLGEQNDSSPVILDTIFRTGRFLQEYSRSNSEILEHEDECTMEALQSSLSTPCLPSSPSAMDSNLARSFIGSEPDIDLLHSDPFGPTLSMELNLNTSHEDYTEKITYDYSSDDEMLYD